MRTKQTSAGALLAGVMFAAVAAGCANQQPTRSGFLADYEGLRPATDGSRVLTTPSSPRLRDYAGVFIEPVQIKLADTAERDGLDEVARLATEALRRELGAQWPVVAAPGPRILRIRSALTAVTRSKPALNVALTVVAVPLANGGLSAEAEFRDSRSGAPIGAVTWADEGRLNPLGYFSELGHARALTDDFARTVAAALNRAN